MAKTLKEISEELGLSVATISRVVNNKSTVSDKTRQQVLDALERHEYTPNLIARDLKTQSSKTLSIIIPDITEDFFGNIVKSATYLLQKEGYSVLLCDSDESAEREEHYLRFLREKRIGGLILASTCPESQLVDKLRDYGVPIVLIDNLFREETSYDAVLIDNTRAGYMGCEHLLKKGHRKIGVITGNQDEYTGRKRLEGCVKAFREYGFDQYKQFIRYGNFKESSGYQGMCSLLEEHPDLDAVFIHSSKMTFGAIKALRERGKRYPDDIALVGFDLTDPYAMYTPTLTSIVQPELEIGEIAAGMILDRVADNKRSLRINFLDPIMLERESG